MPQPQHTSMFSAMRMRFSTKKVQPAQKSLLGNSRAYMVAPGQPVWMDRDYARFSQEAYMRNVVAHRSINLITQSAASIPLELWLIPKNGAKREINNHPLLTLLSRPNPQMSGTAFFEAVQQYRLIGGNAFILATGPNGEAPRELHLLRPDRVAVIAGKGGMPMGYRYTVGEVVKDYPVNEINGHSTVLHIKNFHPLNDWYGLSPIEAAAYSIDQHNQSAAWNQSLLQNGARPSGALVVKMGEGSTGTLSEDQYTRVRQQIDEQFSGSANAGRPLLLEGGLEWKEMSLTPKDMDYIEGKNSAARDIALSFGVPPQLLGIPGDNTYANLQEARLALWEQTVVPLVESTLDAFNHWLAPMFSNQLKLVANTDAVPVLANRNQAIWERVENASFLSQNEKRAAVGYGPAEI